MLSSILCIPLIYYTQPLKNFFLKKIIYEKKTQQNFIFLFFHRSSVPPLRALSFRKTFFEKFLPKSFFIPKTKFLSSFLCIPLSNFCQTIQYSFFMKVFLYAEKNYLKSNFRFSTSIVLTRTYKYAVSKFLFGETLFFKRREFQNCNFYF